MDRIASAEASNPANEHVFRQVLQRGQVVSTRDEALIELIRGKRVIHIGCVDWPVSQARIDSGDLLHSKLFSNASALLGIDVDEKGITALKAAFPGEYLCTDISNSSSNIGMLKDWQPDVVLLGDVVEHLPRPMDLVSSLYAISHATGASVIITTPNSLGIRNFINTILGIELMHPDHLYIHSPQTLRHLVERSGLVIESWNYYCICTGSDLPHRAYDFVVRISAKMRDAWADGHLLVARAVDSTKIHMDTVSG